MLRPPAGVVDASRGGVHSLLDAVDVVGVVLEALGDVLTVGARGGDVLVVDVGGRGSAVGALVVEVAVAAASYGARGLAVGGTLLLGGRGVGGGGLSVGGGGG